ncbi:hypothetical protein F5I97DRAFT_1891553 [Phlebopus sp. FC_14]|nr:hypothetical protein F5I97DRAFT_1891553 [Phlebopus sp. FC_14]
MPGSLSPPCHFCLASCPMAPRIRNRLHGQPGNLAHQGTPSLLVVLGMLHEAYFTRFITMRLSIYSLIVAAGLLGRVAARGIPKSSKSAAAYFITNEPTGNYVIAGSISNNGSLTLSTATPTGGNGSHNSATGPDPFFSQGAVATVRHTSLLATVNAGSSTVSLFFVNPLEPTNLTMIGSPVPSGGDFPIALTFNHLGDNLCVLNGGADNGVQCFEVGSSGLSPISNSQRSLGLNQTTPPNGPPGSASTLVFAKNGASLVAATKGLPGYVAVWDVAANGSLSIDFQKVNTPSGGGLIFSLTPIPGTEGAFLASDPAVGYDIIDLSNPSNSQSYTIANQSANCWSTYSKKTGNYYVVDAPAGILNEVSVDENLQGSLVEQYSYANGSVPLDAAVATIDGADYLYQLLAGAKEVGVVSLASAGEGSVVQTVDIAAFGSEQGITISSDHLAGMATYVSLL